MHIFLVTVFALLLAAGAPAAAQAPPQAPAAKEQAEYAAQVKKAWDAAEETFEDGDYLAAIRRYNNLLVKFPYSKYATLADLRIGDVYFEQEKYATRPGELPGVCQAPPGPSEGALRQLAHRRGPLRAGAPGYLL